MKKITAFFMALMPIFVTALLFLCGLIVKHSTEVPVTSVEIVNNEVVKNVRKLDDESQNKLQINANVLPFNATNPLLHYISSDEKIATVDANGQVTFKSYGEAYIYAYADENHTLNARCKLEVADTIAHNIVVDNQDLASYVGIAQNSKLDIRTVPSINRLDNPNLDVRSSKEDVVKVTTDGTLLPQKEGSATIVIETQNKGEQTQIPLHKEINVTVGPGVEIVDLDNPIKEIIAEPTGYNLYTHLNVAPESKDNIKSTDFTYKCDNSDIAEIDEQGNVKFKAKGVATFHAIYKRDETKHVSKVLDCTFDNFIDIYFTRSDYSASWDEVQTFTNNIIPEEKLTYSVYPIAKAVSPNLTIHSSNTDVIQPSWNADKKKYEFKVNKPGSTVLTAKVNTGIKDKEIKIDNCLVTIGLNKTDLINVSEVQLNNTYYYALRKNIKADTTNVTPQNITFYIVSGSDVATLDHEILHFVKSGTVRVKAEVSYTSEVISKEFDVKCVDSLKTINIDTTPLKPLEAGVRYKLTSNENWQPTFNGCQNKFTINTDGTFIAKSGCSFQEFELKNSSGQLKNVEAVFTEKPLYIYSDVNMFETVDNDEWSPITFKDWANISVYPTTATKDDGSLYQSSLVYDYTVENSTVATVDQGTITFTAPGTVMAKVTLDDETYRNFFIKSTWGGLGKLNLYDTGDNEIIPYTTLSIAPGQEVTIHTKNLSLSEGQQLTYGSENSLVSIQKTHEPELLFPAPVCFTIKANNDTFGDDIVTINTGTYIFYYKIKIVPEIQNVVVVANNQTLTANSTTYTTNLKLQVAVGPTSAKPSGSEIGYTATFNNTSLTITKGVSYDTIDLSSCTFNDGDNVLKFNVGEREIATYTIKYVSNQSLIKIGITGTIEYEEEGELKKGLFLAANSNQKSSLITTDGFVDSSFWDGFSAEVQQTGGAEQVEISGNLLTLTNIASSREDEIYYSKLTLKKNSQTLGEYTIGKDFVTKIVLPKHDNLDRTDKKGMQKVHVYGNKSWYTKEEGMIDYYKLPIDLYNAKHNLIKDDTEIGKNLKALAYSTLVSSINQNCEAKYDVEGGFIKVYFNNDCLYTPTEISQNAFDTLTGKNVTFDIHTKSTLIDANYTFVAVQGINAYCQDAILWIDQHNSEAMNRAVLQTNFGLQGSAESTPFDCFKGEAEYTPQIPAIYGNGYAINFHSWSTTIPVGVQREVNYNFMVNTIMMGCNSDEYKKHGRNCTTTNQSKWQELGCFGSFYNIIKGFQIAFTPDAEVPNSNTYVKNTIFNNNGTMSINQGWNNNQSNLYLENCAFLDAGSFPICAVQDAPVYFKGDMALYNFHGQEMLNGLFDQDLRFLWPALLKAAQMSYMTQIDGAGKELVNSLMCSGLDDKMYFYVGKDETGKDIYEKGIKGRAGAANHLAKYIDIRIPFKKEEKWITIEAGLWATVNSKHEQGAPDYWEAYDKNGQMLPGFFNSQVEKLCRQFKYF